MRNKRKRSAKKNVEMYSMLGPTSVWMILFIMIPICMFVVYSFWIVEKQMIVRVLSLKNYIKFFFIYRRKGRSKSILYMLVVIPLLTSYIVRIYTMRLLLGSKGVINNFLLFLGLIEEPLQILLFNRFAIFLTLCVILSPFMVMPIYTSLEKIPKSFIEAARDLGSNELQTFWRVIFPNTKPGVIAGCMFIFVLSLGDFLTPILVGGKQGTTLSKVIQVNFGFAYDWPLGAALSVILLTISLTIILISNRFGALREV